MTPLEKAIKLRQWCRVANANNRIDDHVFRLNYEADQAYIRLNAEERAGYHKWCFTPEIWAQLRAPGAAKPRKPSR